MEQTFESTKAKRFLGLIKELYLAVALLALTGISVYCAISAWKFCISANHWIIYTAYIFAILLWFSILAILISVAIFSSKYLYLMYKTKIIISENRITFLTYNNRKVEISIDNIQYCWKGPNKITALFKYQDKLFSFNFLKNVYGSESIKSLENLMEKKDCFICSREVIRKIVKENRLNSISKKSKLLHILYDKISDSHLLK